MKFGPIKTDETTKVMGEMRLLEGVAMARPSDTPAVIVNLVLECGFSSEKATEGIRRALNRQGQFVWLEPPSPPGDLTILDVRNTTDFAQHEAMVKRWAETVWQAWSPHHETVRRWAVF